MARLRAVRGPEPGLADVVGQTGELEIWQDGGGRFGISLFWPAALPGGQKPLMKQMFFQESQQYFHSPLVYDLEEDGKAVKLVHGGWDCLMFELIEE